MIDYPIYIYNDAGFYFHQHLIWFVVLAVFLLTVWLGMVIYYICLRFNLFRKREVSVDD